MPLVATKEVPGIGTSGAVPGYPTSDLHQNLNLNLNKLAVKHTQKRRRTRSLALNPSKLTVSTPRNISSRELRARNRRRREKSPIIDLTTDVDFEVLPTNELPVKNTARSKKNSRTKSNHNSVVSETPLDINTVANPKLLHETSSSELNLSPIKKESPRKTGNVSPLDLPRHLAIVPLLLSSPSKRRKTVAFSDNIMSDVPSSPIYRGTEPNMTPQRSILKPAAESLNLSPIDPNNSNMWVKTSHTILHQFSTSSHAPNNPEFWQPGTIIQLEPKSNDLVQLVDGCVEVLSIPDFCRKFEVYATLNQIFKLNDTVILAELFTGDGSGSWLANVEKTTGYRRKTSVPCILELCQFVTRDIEAIEQLIFKNEGNPKLSPSRNNPFQARTLSQCLKFVSSMISIPTINVFISESTIKWTYSRACQLIVKPAISKLLVLPYLSIIKDCPFSSKKRRIIFESSPNPILEQMLFALLNIRNFVSSSLVNEKFIALKNLIQKFPAIMAKNFHHWFSGLVLSLCDISFALYTKIAAIGVTVLLEAARSYLDYPDICLAAREMLEMPLPTNEKSFTTENLISISTVPLTITIDYVCGSLKELIDNGQFKYAMDIWVGLTLLLGHFKSGIENWKHLQLWLHVHKYCFNCAPIHAKVTALASWKAIIYKICICEFKEIRYPATTLRETVKHCENDGPNITPNEKQQHMDEIFRPKIKLLIHIFINISSVEFQKELIDTLDDCFLSILYNLLNMPLKNNQKILLLYWDKIIQPVLMNFYFKKDSSDSHMHQLGVDIFNRLVTPGNPVNEKKFSAIRCLSHDAVTLNEISSLSPRWIYAHFERILPLLLTIFRLKYLDIEVKMNALSTFLKTLKLTTKKELQPSDTTLDVIESFPMVLQVFFDHNTASYDLIFKMIVNINDTFGVSNMIIDYDGPGIFEVILANSMDSLDTHKLNAILSMLCGAVGERKCLLFISRVMEINKKFKRPDIAQFVGQYLNNRKSTKFSHQDMIIMGNIFRLLDQNFAAIAKKLIQHVVLLKAHEFDKMVQELGIVHWNIQIFKFFVTLMHDAPFEHLKQTNLKLIKSKLNSDDFEMLFTFLVENRFDNEIWKLQEVILSTLKHKADERLVGIWLDYLSSFEGESRNLDQLLCASVDIDIDILSIVHNNWTNLPLSKEKYKKKYGSLPSETVPESNSDSLVEKQVELEQIIKSELEEDSSNSSLDMTDYDSTGKNSKKTKKSEKSSETLIEPDLIGIRGNGEVERIVESNGNNIDHSDVDETLTSDNSELFENLLDKIEPEKRQNVPKKRQNEQILESKSKRQKSADDSIDTEEDKIQFSDSESAENNNLIRQVESNESDMASSSAENDSENEDSLHASQPAMKESTSEINDTTPTKLSVVTVTPAQEMPSGTIGVTGSTELPGLYQNLKQILASVKDKDLEELHFKETDELETLFMEFLIRMRHLRQQYTCQDNIL